MAMVCPQCHTAQEQRLHCSTCNVRLVYHDLHGKGKQTLRPGGHWMQSFAGRLLIGLVLAQGLYFGLRHLITGSMLALYGEEGLQEYLQTLPGVILLESLQVVPLIIGAMLAAASQRQAFIFGFVLGLANGFLCMVTQLYLTHTTSSLSWYGQPLLQAGCGCLGAWIGALIWKPQALPVLPGQAARKAAVARKSPPLLAGPVAWFRVSLGALLVVAGNFWAEFLFETALRASAGKLETTSYLQDKIFTWEIRALAVLFGAAVAGATTRNGIKQGLCVGLIATLILLAMPSSHATATVALLTAISTFSLSTAGGWFGSQLLPPVVARPRNTSGPAGG